MESQRRTELIEHAEPQVRHQALALLDELTRPLTVREMDAQLAPYYTRTKRREICKALYFLEPIVLLSQRHEQAKKPYWSGSGHGASPPPRSRSRRRPGAS